MDKKYIELFTKLAEATQLLSEQVIKLDKEKNDTKGLETATTMRDDYKQLFNKIKADNFNPDNLTKRDYAQLLVGAIIIVKQGENKVEAMQKALDSYRTDLIPKLEKIVNEADVDDEKRIEMAKEFFEIKTEN